MLTKFKIMAKLVKNTNTKIKQIDITRQTTVPAVTKPVFQFA